MVPLSFINKNKVKKMINKFLFIGAIGLSAFSVAWSCPESPEVNTTSKIKAEADKQAEAKGPIVRLRPLQNRGLKGVAGNHWKLEEHTAQDVLAMIRKMKPKVLERYISGPFDPKALVPVAPGEPPMTVVKFLNESMKAGAPGCTIVPRIGLEKLYGEPCSWDKKYADNCFYAVSVSGFDD